MKVIHGSRPDDYEETDFKTCPICGAVCFADMDICFGCLHRFTEDTAPLPLDRSSADIANADDRVQIETGAQLPSTALTSAEAHETCTPEPRRETPQPFDHTRDIASLQKPARIQDDPCDRPCQKSDDGSEMTSRHVCSDREGRQFEVSICVKLL